MPRAINISKETTVSEKTIFRRKYCGEKIKSNVMPTDFRQQQSSHRNRS